MRWARATACASVVGLVCGSHRTTTDAAWRLRPTPPTSIWLTSTRGSSAAVKSSTIVWRVRAGTEPVRGGSARSPRARTATSTTSRKYENTTTLRPFSAASRAISTSRRSFAESSGCSTANAARRMAMNDPAATASRYAAPSTAPSRSHSSTCTSSGSSSSTSSALRRRYAGATACRNASGPAAPCAASRRAASSGWR
ncbi:Uncharacterised protein [Mycobacteroides abscessus]|nr:Uncharacterised protein [Mycobacteroides abscessus]